MGRVQGQFRRLCAAGAAFCLAVAVLMSTPDPAAAAKAAPWRWSRVDQTIQVAAGGTGSADLPCPAAYIPVSGGYGTQNAHIYRMREYPDYTTNSYVIVVANPAPIAVDVGFTAHCAHGDDVGPVSNHSASAVESGDRAQVFASCPDGYGVLRGGANWATTGARRIDSSGPRLLGDAWYASGTSAATNDTLLVVVGCVPHAVLAELEVVSDTRDYPARSLGGVTADHLARCSAGNRVMTGGAYARPYAFNGFASTDFGHTFRTYPEPGGWRASFRVKAGVATRFTAVALCVPVSTPTAEFTQVPPQLSSAASGQFAFSASDPAGEPVTSRCRLDGPGVGCAPGMAVPYGPLADGPHWFRVSVTNGSGQTVERDYYWTVDSTPPAVATKAPTSSVGLAGAFRVTFSEPVRSVNSSTFRVFPAGSSVPLKGVIARQGVDTDTNTATGATFRPAAALVPGQRYRAALSAAIHDPAGNDLSATSWRVRAVTAVENTSPALVESWDPDSSGVASGGGYASSRTRGTTATLRFRSAAGDAVSLWGVRVPRGGNATIFLDGVKRETVSFYAASLRRARVWRVTGLTAGEHRLQVRVLGTKPSASKGTWVGLDSLDVGARTFQERALRQAFRRVNTSAASGGSYDIVSHATAGDTGGKPSYRMSFRGTRIRLYAIKTPDSGVAIVYIDGVRRATVNLRASSKQHDVNVFETQVRDRVHRLRVEARGTSSGARSGVAMDHLLVD